MDGTACKTLRMPGVGSVESGLALVADLFGGSEVDGREGVHPDAGITVPMVVGKAEAFAEGACVLQRP